MTREEAIESLRGILTEAVEFENSVCYVTEEDREPLEMAIKALEQEKPETVTEFADRCRECGAKYGKSLKQEPCEDCISRREAIKMFTYNYKGERIPDYDCDNFPVQIAIKTVKEMLRELPSVNPQYTENEIQKMQDIEQAEIEKAYELGRAEQPKTGHWIFDEILDKHYYCSECKSMGVDYWDFCPYCGAKMVEPQESEDKE